MNKSDIKNLTRVAEKHLMAFVDEYQHGLDFSTMGPTFESEAQAETFDLMRALAADMLQAARQLEMNPLKSVDMVGNEKKT